jgi:hypothetical protein
MIRRFRRLEPCFQHSGAYGTKQNPKLSTEIYQKPQRSFLSLPTSTDRVLLAHSFGESASPQIDIRRKPSPLKGQKS